jgi:hypothetical protein
VNLAAIIHGGFGPRHRAVPLSQFVRDKPVEHAEHIRHEGEDRPQVRDRCRPAPEGSVG